MSIVQAVKLRDYHKYHVCFANLSLVAVNRELLGFCPKRNLGFK
jgi:hypothetical protein